MAQSQLDLYNKALSVIGADYTVEAVDEASVPAETCELWYDEVRRVVLRAAHWGSARKVARLTLEAERDLSADWVTSDPEPGFAYSYVIPSDLLAARYLSHFGEFTISNDDDEKILNTNWGSDTASERPVLIYTFDQTDVSKWEPDLYVAIAYSLAAQITMPLTGKLARVRSNLEMAYDLVLQARVNTANEIHRMMQSQPEILSLRGYSYSPSTPYIYPYGSWFSTPGAPVL